MDRVVAAVAAVVIALVIVKIDFGAPMESLPPQEIGCVTTVLYKDGEADSGELDLGSLLSTCQHTGQLSMIFLQKLRSVHAGAPEVSDWVQLHFTYKDGRKRELRLTETDKRDYIEEPGVGIWHKKKERENELHLLGWIFCPTFGVQFIFPPLCFFSGQGFACA